MESTDRNWMDGRWMDGPWMDGGWMMWPMLAAATLIVLAAIVVALAVVRLARPVIAGGSQGVASGALRRLPESSRFRSSATAAPAANGPWREQEAFLLIPDISGYTGFMKANQLSLGHAQFLISELLEAMVASVEGAFTAAKVEGDAVLLWAPTADEADDGRPSDDAGAGPAIERVLRAFYRRRAELMAANLCNCAGCRHIVDLDIKVVVHRGRILVYDLRGTPEISGMPVIVAHRMLKNRLNRSRYVLVSEEAAPTLDFAFTGTGERCGVDCEGVGEVRAIAYDFDPAALGWDVPAADPGVREKLSGTLDKLKVALDQKDQPATR